MGVLVRAAAVVGLLSVVSCWSPVFDADVSLASVTASKLSLDADFPASLSTYGDASAYWALPDSQRPPTRVAVASLGNTGTHVALYQKSGGQWVSSGYGTGYGYDAPLVDPYSATLHVGMSTATFSVAVYLPTAGSGTVEFIDSSAQYPAMGVFTPSVLGVGSMPSYATFLNADIYFLAKTGGSYFLYTQNSNAATAFPAPTGGYVWTGSITGLTAGYGWLAVNPVPATPVAYLTHSEKTNGQYTTQMFDNNQVLGSWTRSDRVVMVLSSHKLLTRDGAYYNVCSLTGGVEYSFPAGALQFAGEFYDGSRYQCWFTQVLSDDASQGSSNQRVRIYSIPTLNLGNLK